MMVQVLLISVSNFVSTGRFWQKLLAKTQVRVIFEKWPFLDLCVPVVAQRGRARENLSRWFTLPTRATFEPSYGQIPDIDMPHIAPSLGGTKGQSLLNRQGNEILMQQMPSQRLLNISSKFQVIWFTGLTEFQLKVVPLILGHPVWLLFAD